MTQQELLVYINERLRIKETGSEEERRNAKLELNALYGKFILGQN